MCYKTIFASILAALAALGLCLQYSAHSLLKAQEKIVMDFYRPSAERARAAQNPDTTDPDRGDAPLEIANLIAGYRNIIILYEPFFKSFAEEPEFQDYSLAYNALKIILQNRIRENKIHILPVPRAKHAGISLVILYTDKAEKNAFLLAKVEEEESSNGYLYGLLLGYRKDDIEFFYKISAFISRHKEEEIPEDPFANWPQPLKDEFYHFVQFVWPHSSEFERYQKYINEAQQWLIKNNAAELFI